MTTCWRYRRIPILGLLILLALGRGQAVSVAQQGNALLIDGLPTVLTFARGCTDPAQVPAYRAQGFNTLLVRVDSPGTIALENARELLAAGEEAGLYLLVELANGNWSEGELACLSDKEYLETAEYFVDSVVADLQRYPRLLGWIISTVEEGRLITNMMTIGEFLERRYKTTDELNAAWSVKEGSGRVFRSRVTSFGVLTEKEVERLANTAPAETGRVIRRQLDDYRRLHATRDADFLLYLKRYYNTAAEVNARWGFKFSEWEKISVEVLERREREQPGSSLPSQLELARYKSEVRRHLLDWWAQQIRVRDPDRLVFGGGMTDYRGMSNLPASLNGVFTECYPGTAEVDVEGHNPHAIDIARHGNRRIVLAGISARDAEPFRFVYYLYGAALHGAAGIGVNDWETVSRSDILRGALAKSLGDIDARKLLGRSPAPRIAIVYTPYTPGRYTSGRPLYGYLPPFISDGPGNLIFRLRNGTSYGQIDYLSPEDLVQAPLSRYAVVLLLSALDLPRPSMLALTRYVGSGGLLLADVGAGTLQANGNHLSLPPELTQLFRVQNYDTRLSEDRLNLEVYRSTPLFPRLVAGMRTLGLYEGFAVRFSARFRPVEGSDLLFALVAKRGFDRPVPRPYKPLPRVPTRGIFIAGHGNGLAIFAPMPLYQCWLPGNMLFEEFHRDLFGRNADTMFRRPIDFLPPRAALSRYADGSVALWTRDEVQPVAWVRNPERVVYNLPGGSCEIMAGGTNLSCGSSGYHLAEPLPVRIARMDLPVIVRVLQADAAGLVLQFRAKDDLAGEVITLEIGDGAYRVAPGSAHRLIWLTDADGGEIAATADENGLLHIDVPLSEKLTTITLLDSSSGGNLQIAPSRGGDIVIEAVPAAG
jgi:hypothetical protein